MPALEQVRWTTDRVRDKSSWDVLLDWLATEGNYARWSDEKQPKDVLYKEILGALAEQGIHHRSDKNVYSKVWHVEKTLEAAQALLVSNGIGGDVDLSRCDSRLKYKIMRTCPNFERLAPVMTVKSKRRKKSKDVTRSTKRLRSSEAVEEEPPAVDDILFAEEAHAIKSPAANPPASNSPLVNPPVAKSPAAKSPSSVSVRATNEEPKTSVEQPQPESQPSQPLELPQSQPLLTLPQLSQPQLSLPEDPEPSTVEVPESGADVESVEPEEIILQQPQEELEDLPPIPNEGPELEVLQSEALQQIPSETSREKIMIELEFFRLRNEFTLETIRKKQGIEIEIAQERAQMELAHGKSDLDAARERTECTLAVERALSRQEMLSAGIPQAEVDRIMPSKPWAL